MQITTRVEIDLFVLENTVVDFNSDYYYLIETIDTELCKELDGRKLVFYAETTDEIAKVEDDLIKILIHLESAIEEFENKKVS